MFLLLFVSGYCTRVRSNKYQTKLFASFRGGCCLSSRMMSACRARPRFALSRFQWSLLAALSTQECLIRMMKLKREKKGRFYVCQRSGCSFFIYTIPTKFVYTKQWILDFPLYQWQQRCHTISYRFIHTFSFKRGSREESTPPSAL